MLLQRQTIYERVLVQTEEKIRNDLLGAYESLTPVDINSIRSDDSRSRHVDDKLCGEIGSFRAWASSFP